MIETPKFGVVKLEFEEQGSNFLIYKLLFNEKAFEEEKVKWNKVQFELEEISKKIKQYFENQDYLEDWCDNKTITSSYEYLKNFYQVEIFNKINQLSVENNVAILKDIYPHWKLFESTIDKEFSGLWNRIQHGHRVRENLVSFYEIFKAKMLKVSRAIDERMKFYKEFKKASEKEILLLAKIYINDWKTENFDVVFSFEEYVGPNLSIFLYQEVYRNLRREVVDEAKFQVKELEDKCLAIINAMKNEAIYKFLCRVDNLLINYNVIANNKFVFDKFVSLNLTNFINRLKSSESTISARLVVAKTICEYTYENLLGLEIKKDDFVWLVICDLLSMNTVEFFSIKDDQSWESRVETVAKQIEWRLKKESFEEISKDLSVKVVPWKTLEVLNPKYAQAFWQAWKKNYFSKNYPGCKITSTDYIITTNQYKDQFGEYQEAFSIYLFGIHLEEFKLKRKSSIERNVNVIQQRGVTVQSGTMISIGVQLSFIAETFILESNHKKQFSM